MKKPFKIGLMVMFSITLLSTTCSSDDEGMNNDNAVQIQEIENTAESGTWIVTYFFDTDQVETSNFNGYQFLFNSDGTITSTNTTATVTGTWSITDDSNSNSSSSSSSSSSDDIDFNILFSSPPNFEELSDDWDIVTISANKIELKDVSGGNGGTDYLTFEKQ